jgi:hypothetical protein
VSRGFTGGKREREANRARRKRDKVERLRHNREQAGSAPASDDPLGLAALDPSLAEGSALPPVDLADVVIGVASRPKREPLTPAKLFVGGLSRDTTTEDLQMAFSNFGKIVDAVVINDRNTGRSRGFGFVTFEKHADADEAIKQLHGKELDGRPLKVNRAEPS